MKKSSQEKQAITLHINGKKLEAIIRNSDTLLYTIREQLGLMGAKPGCNNGDCGSCTVLVNDMPINACHILTIEAVGHEIMTIEGLKHSSIQSAFIDQWAIQCGYCTSGYILNAYALAKRYPNATDEVIDEWFDSNLCRCTGYQEIKKAMRSTLKGRVANE